MLIKLVAIAENNNNNNNSSAHLLRTRFPSYLASAAASMLLLNDEGWNEMTPVHIPDRRFLNCALKLFTLSRVWHCEGIPSVGGENSLLVPRLFSKDKITQFESWSETADAL